MFCERFFFSFVGEFPFRFPPMAVNTRWNSEIKMLPFLALISPTSSSIYFNCTSSVRDFMQINMLIHLNTREVQSTFNDV